MRIRIGNVAERLATGVKAIAAYQYLELSEEGVLLHAKEGDAICIEKSAKEITITYDTETHFYMALARSIALPEGKHQISPKFKRLGFQIDCSRNAVATPERVKKLLCLLVLAGYDSLQLYTEDTYELEGEPYFGYMRGRYSVEELREIIDFAQMLGVEMVPCIQTLAHMVHFNNWLQYYQHMDVKDIMLVDDEWTYDLIRKMLSFWVDNFGFRRINIGMDEAHLLGMGKHLAIHGYEPKDEIYLRHLKKVFDICKEVGVVPEFWADMLWKTQLPLEKIQEVFDGTQTPICWEYGHRDEEFYEKTFQKLKDCAGRVMYAGACLTWIGFAPNNKFSMEVDNAAFAVAERHGMDHMLITTWGDNGAECSVFATIASMWHAAMLTYPSEADIDTMLLELTGYTQKEWLCCDCINTTKPEIDEVANVVKYAFYNDPLIGLLDENIAEDAGEVYAKYCKMYAELAKKDSPFSYIFQSYASMSHVLEKKATFGKRLYKAYHTGDREAVRPFIEELSEIIARTEVFYQDYRKQWHMESKGFGFEVFDNRVGGLIHRAKSAQQTLADYANGTLEKVGELEAERLTYFDGRLEGEKRYAAQHNRWDTLFTVNCV